MVPWFKSEEHRDEVIIILIVQEQLNESLDSGLARLFSFLFCIIIS